MTAYEARFQKLEVLLLHGSSSSSIPVVTQPEGGNTKLGSPEKFLLTQL
jgi:hypothetical protein